jgi:hypothetical protein
MLVALASLPAQAGADSGEHNGPPPASAAALPVAPASAVTLPEVSIPFADHGGIRDWRVVDDATLLLQDVHDQWYLAKLFAPVYDLAYVERIAFITPPSGSLEKFGSILVHGRRYPIVSLTRAPAPAARPKK